MRILLQDEVGGITSDLVIYKKKNEIIELESELSGASERVKFFCKKSLESGEVAIVPSAMLCHGKIFNSALVIDKGYLLGTVDMLHKVNLNYDLGSILRVYDTSIGRIGIVIGEDLFFPEVARLLRLLLADLLIVFAENIEDKKALVLAQARAIENEITVALAISNKLIINNATYTRLGQNMYEVELMKNDKLLQMRREELYRRLSCSRMD